MQYSSGCCLMVSLKGSQILKEEESLIVKEGIAGVILFQRNILSVRQLFELCRELKSLASKRSSPFPFFIGIDLEGGRVDRLSHLKDSPRWPSALEMSGFPSEQLFQLARVKGQFLKALGIDINFAPVVDIPLKKSSLLEGRTFGNKKEDIASSALTYSKGLLKGGVMPCLKHFPGHGGVTEDSHKTLPRDNRDLKSLEPQLNVFKEVLKAPVPFVMTAHLEFPKVELVPATFSSLFLRRELRDRLQFKGVIVSDDVDMEALTDFSPEERFFKALSGGCNLVLCCQKPETPYKILEFFKNSKEQKNLQPFLEDSFLKLMSVKKNFNPC